MIPRVDPSRAATSRVDRGQDPDMAFITAEQLAYQGIFETFTVMLLPLTE